MILSMISESKIEVFADTLLSSWETNSPLMFSSKVLVLPHLSALVFSTGALSFLRKYHRYLEENVIAQDIDYVSEISQQVLWDLKSEFEIGHAMETTSIYLVGFSPLHEANVAFRFSFLKFFEREVVHDSMILSPATPDISTAFQDLCKDTSLDHEGLTSVAIRLYGRPEFGAGGDLIRYRISDKKSQIIDRIMLLPGKEPMFQTMLNHTRLSFDGHVALNTTVYFDNNVWSRLTELCLNEGRGRVVDYAERIKKLKLLIVYSHENVKESMKRPIPDQVFTELWVMSCVTDNCFVDGKGELSRRNPFEVRQQIANEIPVVQMMISEFQEALQELQISVGQDSASVEFMNRHFDSKKLNNLPPEEATTAIFKIFHNIILNETAASSPAVPDKAALSRFFDRIVILMGNMIRKNIPVGIHENLLDGYLLAIRERLSDAIKTVGMKNNLEFAAQATNFTELFTSFGIPGNMTPATVSGILQAFQYWPDQPKLLKKKKTVVDVEDLVHASVGLSCTYFVTNDKHLRIRLLAAAHETGNSVIVMDNNAFDAMIESASV